MSRPRRKYRVMYSPSHPRAMSHGLVFEHVAVLWEKLSGKDVPCHWCEIPLRWGHDLQTDHVNGDPQDNDPDNLVPSCQSCNIQRGKNGGQQPVPKYLDCLICGRNFRRGVRHNVKTCSKSCATTYRYRKEGPRPQRICEVEGCESRYNAKGLCRRHYNISYWRSRRVVEA